MASLILTFVKNRELTGAGNQNYINSFSSFSQTKIGQRKRARNKQNQTSDAEIGLELKFPNLEYNLGKQITHQLASKNY